MRSWLRTAVGVCVLATSGVLAEERIPDPFITCTNVEIETTTADLGYPEPYQHLTLDAVQTLRAPTAILISRRDSKATIPASARATVRYGEGIVNTCYYHYDAERLAFALEGCELMEKAGPAMLASIFVELQLSALGASSQMVFRASMASAPPCPGRPPLQGKYIERSGSVSGEYLVVLDELQVSTDQVDGVAEEMARAVGATVTHVYRYSIIGFDLRGADPGRTRELAVDGRIRFIETNVIWRAHAIQGTGTPNSVDWHLNRIDQRPAFTAFNDYYYKYPTTPPYSRSGRRIYILDNGILSGHDDFNEGSVARVAHFIDTTNRGFALCDNGLTVDGSHGTSVASIAAGRLSGSSKTASIHNVRVLGQADAW